MGDQEKLGYRFNKLKGCRAKERVPLKEDNCAVHAGKDTHFNDFIWMQRRLLIPCFGVGSAKINCH